MPTEVGNEQSTVSNMRHEDYKSSTSQQLATSGFYAVPLVRPLVGTFGLVCSAMNSGIVRTNEPSYLHHTKLFCWIFALIYTCRVSRSARLFRLTS
jgi:hypothetical protein